MFRLLLALVTVCTIQCVSVEAQGRSGRWFRGWGSSSKWGRGSAKTYKQPSAANRGRYREPTLFGFGIGVGSYPNYGYPRPGEFNPYRFDNYVYDPYRFGSFTAPDLLNDPYFRERHRYDSHFPGRRRPPLQLAPTAPRTGQPSYTVSPRESGTNLYPSASQPITAVPPADLTGQLGFASEQLSKSLSAREDDGEAWTEYLAPHQIRPWIESGNEAGLRELLTHYDGVVANPELRSVTKVPGFAQTRTLLRQYVGDPSDTHDPVLQGPRGL